MENQEQNGRYEQEYIFYKGSERCQFDEIFKVVIIGYFYIGFYIGLLLFKLEEIDVCRYIVSQEGKVCQYGKESYEQEESLCCQFLGRINEQYDVEYDFKDDYEYRKVDCLFCQLWKYWCQEGKLGVGKSGFKFCEVLFYFVSCIQGIYCFYLV